MFNNISIGGTMDKIVDKIKKLLALANSSNENEAQLASTKAQELMMKYNLELSKIDSKDKDIKSEFIGEARKKVSYKESLVLALINEFFNVQTVSIRRRGDNGNETVHDMIGEKHNVEIAKYVYDFLMMSFEQQFQAYKKETGCPLSSKKSFMTGIYHGFYKKMEETNNKIVQENALVVVKDKDVERFVFDKYKNLKKTNTKTDTRDINAFESGKEAGGKMNVRRGINDASSGNDIKLIR